MTHSYFTEDIESFFMLIGIFTHLGYDLDFEYMRLYHKEHPDKLLVYVRED